MYSNWWWLQFDQNPILRKALFDTKGTTLIEASPYDKIWGIGLGLYDKRALDRNQWIGQNRFGECLMEVRDKLIEKYGDLE